MSEAKLMSISDFLWASAAQYMIYIGNAAGLVEVSASHINNFRLGKKGVQGLLAQKLGTLSVLQENRRKLERIVGRKSEEMGPNELAVIRGMWHSINEAYMTVDVHCGQLRELEEIEQTEANLFDAKEEEELIYAQLF